MFRCILPSRCLILVSCVYRCLISSSYSGCLFPSSAWRMIHRRRSVASVSLTRSLVPEMCLAFGLNSTKQDKIIQEAFQGIGLSLVGAFIILSIATSNVIVSVLATFCIASMVRMRIMAAAHGFNHRRAELVDQSELDKHWSLRVEESGMVWIGCLVANASFVRSSEKEGFRMVGLTDAYPDKSHPCRPTQWPLRGDRGRLRCRARRSCGAVVLFRWAGWCSSP